MSLLDLEVFCADLGFGLARTGTTALRFPPEMRPAGVGSMATNNGRTAREEAYFAAARRFPHAELAIRRLLRASDTFRDICEELAEAEVALSFVPRTLSALSEERRREYQDLVDRLVGEVSAALTESEARAIAPGARRG